MCKSLTNYFPRDNDFLVTYFGKTQISSSLPLSPWSLSGPIGPILPIGHIKKSSDCSLS